MNRLVSVIGAAPSELSWQALREKIQEQRNRIRIGIEWWQSSVGRKASAKGKKPKITLKDIREVAAKLNMTVAEVEELLSQEADKLKGAAQ